MVVAFSLPASAQKIMRLDETLKANSEPLTVKMRGGSMIKYDFGVYKNNNSQARA
jgi:hypothetical protein